MIAVGSDGTAQPPSDDSQGNPEPNAEDRHRAQLLAEGGNFAPDAEDLFARGIAVVRSGGDVTAFLRQQVAENRNKRGNTR